MKKITRYLLIIVLFLFSGYSYSQNVAINNTGTAPNSNAILDIDHTGNNKGILIPRVTTAQRTAIAGLGAGDEGLTVYDEDTNTYWLWDGTAWVNFAVAGGGGSGWELLGNAGTVSGTNFIGTTDAQSLDFKAMNMLYMRLDRYSGRLEFHNTSESVIIGNGAAFVHYYWDTYGFIRNVIIGENAAYNSRGINDAVVIGYHALGNGGTYASNSTAIGSYALENTTVTANTAVGYAALRANTTGSSNTAVGENALLSNTTGDQNVAIGGHSLMGNAAGADYNTAVGYSTLRTNNGDNNSAFGYYALDRNSTGYNNTATGYKANEENSSGYNNVANGSESLHENTTGYENTAIGQKALYANSLGDYNTATGSEALIANTNGNYNTALGYQAFSTGATFSNATGIGYLAIPGASNKVRIGNASVSVIEGQVAWSFPSDKRFKNNIQEKVVGLEFIMNLRPITFNIDVDKSNQIMGIDDKSDYKGKYDIEKITQSGFIAQEIETAANEVGYNFNGVHPPQNENDYYTVSYATFVVPLVKGMQEQQEQIEKQKEQNQTQQQTIEELQNSIQEMQKQIQELQNK